MPFQIAKLEVEVISKCLRKTVCTCDQPLAKISFKLIKSILDQFCMYVYVQNQVTLCLFLWCKTFNKFVSCSIDGKKCCIYISKSYFFLYRENNITPQVDTYTALIVGYAANGDLKGIDRVSWETISNMNPCVFFLLVHRTFRKHGMLAIKVHTSSCNVISCRKMFNDTNLKNFSQDIF